MRRAGCWLLAAALVVIGCLALSGCRATSSEQAVLVCRDAGGTPVYEGGYYAHCEVPPPCPPLPAAGATGTTPEGRRLVEVVAP